MYLVTSNPAKNLLHLRYIDHVQPADLERGRADLVTLLADLSPHLRVLVDFTQLEHMGLDCVAEIGLGMELIDQRGVEVIARVVPDPRKDIGLNILTVFHYKSSRPRVVTCKNLAEAAEVLGL
jgi:hypothetical protein